MKRVAGTVAILAIGGALGCHPISQTQPKLSPTRGMESFQQGACFGSGEMMGTGYGESAPPTATVTRSVVYRGARRYCFTRP